MSYFLINGEVSCAEPERVNAEPFLKNNVMSLCRHFAIQRTSFHLSGFLPSAKTSCVSASNHIPIITESQNGLGWKGP